VAFQTEHRSDATSDVREGILVDTATRRAYPVVDGVPVMLEESLTDAFLTRHRAAIAGNALLSGLSLKAGPGQEWSFSREWEEHFETDSDRTWGYTVRERLEQLFMETDTAPDWFDGKLVLDAGCGNGALSEEVAGLGATVVGLDYSSSVRGAERVRRADHVHFLQGDLQIPPLGEGLFDLVFSIGVLHHTPETLKTFQAVSRLVKPGGKFYVWLYRRPERFVGRHIKVPVYDLLRAVICRFPPTLQDTAVKAYARLVRATHHLKDRTNPIPLREYVVSAYDDLTPRWRHYHTPIEVSRWFHEAGFTAPTLSHWDNRYGFGLVATRAVQASTPGLHYGTGARLWDDSKTVLGKLHAD
jgi:SAM-dependent methyltransferase/uncharacterized protein YbaR (Trm112 family)